MSEQRKVVREFLTAWAAHIRAGGPMAITLKQAEMLDAAVLMIRDDAERRDRIAAMCLAAIYQHHTMFTDRAALLAYEQADEMMKVAP